MRQTLILIGFDPDDFALGIASLQEVVSLSPVAHAGPHCHTGKINTPCGSQIGTVDDT